MISWLDPVAARRVACFITCIGVALASLEWLVPAGKLGPDGLLAPRPFGAGGAAAERLLALWRPSGLRLTLALRLVCAAVFPVSVLFAPRLAGAGVAVFVAGLLCLPLRFRDPVGVLTGMNGAEQMMTTTLLVLGATFLLRSTVATEAALVFIAMQSLLDYASAGWTKLSDWRGWASGAHLRRVASSGNHGHPGVARLAGAHPALAGALSVGVIALEIAVPLAVVLPAPFAEILLLAALVFHLGSAAVMGFNTFVWAYAATFPAILHCRDGLFVILMRPAP